MIKLGSKVRDCLTGFQGTATARVEFLYGCARILIEPAELKDGKPIDGHYVDEQRVELIKEMQPSVSPQNSATSGGPYDAPTRQTLP